MSTQMSRIDIVRHFIDNWLIHTYAMTHSHVFHDSFICVPWLIHMSVMTHSHVCHDSFTCLPWLIHMDSFTCVPWLIHMSVMTHSYVCHDSFTCVPWLIHMCAMTHSHVCHDSRQMSQNDLPKATRKDDKEERKHVTPLAKRNHTTRQPEKNGKPPSNIPNATHLFSKNTVSKARLDKRCS